VSLPEDDKGAAGVDALEEYGSLSKARVGRTRNVSSGKSGNDIPLLRPMSERSQCRQIASVELPITQSMLILEDVSALMLRPKASVGSISSLGNVLVEKGVSCNHAINDWMS
jgi:hypothetical protein